MHSIGSGDVLAECWPGLQVNACCHMAAAEVDGGMHSPALSVVHLRRAAHEIAQGAAGSNRAGGRAPRSERAAAAPASDAHRHLPPSAPLPLVLHRLGAALLHRPGTASAAGAAGAAAAALRAASAPLRGAAALWLRRGEAGLRAGVAAAEGRRGAGTGLAVDTGTTSSGLSQAFWGDTDSLVQLPGCLPARSSSREWRVLHSAHTSVGAQADDDGHAKLAPAAAETLGNGNGNGKHVKGGVRGTSTAAMPAAQQAVKQERAQRVAREALLDEAEACFCNALLLMEEEAADAASCEAPGDAEAAGTSTPAAVWGCACLLDPSLCMMLSQLHAWDESADGAPEERLCGYI